MNAAVSSPRRGVCLECLVLHSRSAGTTHSLLTAAFPTSGASGEQAVIAKCLKALQGQVSEFSKKDIEQNLSDYQRYFYKESSGEDANNLWIEFAKSTKSRSADKYKQTFTELMRLLQISERVKRLDHLSHKLKNATPKWYTHLENKAQDTGIQAIEKDWAIAWRWKCLNEWLNKLHSRESVDNLQPRVERARKKERELIIQLVKERTWQRQLANVKDHHYRALVAWADAMRKYGKTGGKYRQHWLSRASKAMIDAVGAVPAWIMPLHRVVQSFQAKPGIFDAVIVDEASQCDLRALPVLFRAKKVIVVGDPEQISPSSVGIDRSKVFELNNQFLSDIPHADTTFLIDNSLYDISKTIPRMDRTLLTEHFRCVPPIIEFNNHLCPNLCGTARTPAPTKSTRDAETTH